MVRITYYLKLYIIYALLYMLTYNLFGLHTYRRRSIVKRLCRLLMEDFLRFSATCGIVLV